MKVFRFDVIDSTNNFLKNMKNMENFDLVIAKEQTAGRGRRGNKWISEEGAALFSFALRVEETTPLEEYMKLPLVVGYSVLKALTQKINKNFMFKWTNDVYLNNKKVSGILIEKVGNFFIIGIGININNCNFEGVDYASSIFKETNQYYDVEEIIFHVLSTFKEIYEKFINGAWNEILYEINQKNFLLDKNVEIKIGEEKEYGRCREINEDGTLKVIIGNEEKNFSVGEIHLSWY
jgi:BirA family biotin operon repressor/biotin-[acetyl-CoA-carboxylase] ligase